MVRLDDNIEAQVMKTLLKKVRHMLRKRMRSIMLVLYSKFILGGYGSFKFLKGVNAYKMNLQGEYNVSVIFKVSNLFLFNVGDDSRLNSFEERGDDVILAMTLKDLLGVSIRYILRPKMKWIQEEFNGLSQETWVKKVQIYQSRPLSTFQVIYEDESITDTILIGLELDICTFPTLCGKPVNSSR